MARVIHRLTNKMKTAWLISMEEHLAAATQNGAALTGITSVGITLAPFLVVVIVIVRFRDPMVTTTIAVNSTHTKNAAAVVVDILLVVTLV